MALRRVRGLPRRVPRLARAPGRLLVDDRRPGRACRRARLLRSRFRSHPLARHQSHRARDVLKFSVQTRELKETAAVPTSEGLVVNLDVSLLFRLRPEAAARVYKTVGSRFEGVVIDPQLRSIIRDVTAEYEAKFLYSASREVVAQNMFSSTSTPPSRHAGSRRSRSCSARSSCRPFSRPPSMRSSRPSSKLNACGSCSIASVKKPSASAWRPRASRTSSRSSPAASAPSS